MKRGLIKNRDEGRIVTVTRDTAGQDRAGQFTVLSCPVVQCPTI